MQKLINKTLHQSYFVVALAIGILAGAIIALVFRINFFNSPIWIALAVLLLIIIYLKPKYVFIGLAFMAGMILIFFRTTSELSGENYIRQFWGQTILITGTVDGDPNTDEEATKLKLTNLKFGEEKIETKGSIFVSINQTEEIKRADIVTINGSLKEGFGVYAGYMFRPKIESIKRPTPGDFVLNVRNWFSERVKTALPETEANLGLSYLLGMKANLNKELNDNLRIVGLTHIVVASGAHLAILVEIARKIFGKISRFAGVFFSILFVIIFMSIVGWTPSIMRAGIMAILTLITWQVGRAIAPWRLILIVASFTLIINPMYIINLGWLLSFSAYIGIMLCPGIIKFFCGTKKPNFITSTVIVTISATLMTLPISLYFFGTLSLISILANLLILPTLPYAMGLTFLTGFFANIPLLNSFFQLLTTKLLDYHIFIVDFFSKMKEFLIVIPPYQAWVFLIYLFILVPFIIVWIKKIYHLKKPRPDLAH